MSRSSSAGSPNSSPRDDPHGRTTTRRSGNTMAQLDYEAINSGIRYVMYSVFRVTPGVLGSDRSATVKEAQAYFDGLEDRGVVLRGLYDVAGLRADAEWMMWTHASAIEPLQAAYSELRRTTELGEASTPVWSNCGVHRPAEFNKQHIP